MVDEAQEILDDIKALIKNRGLDIVNEDVRTSKQGGNWRMTLKLTIKPKVQVEAEV